MEELAAGSSTDVQFRASITAPYEDVKVKVELPPEPDIPAPTCPVSCAQDTISDVLPMILVGMGVAYMLGFTTGAFIFSASQ